MVMDESITSSLRDTRQKLLENFDSEVHEKLKVNIKESQSYLDCYERWLWDITRFYLGDNADFVEHEYSFMLKSNPFPNEDIHRGPYRIGKNIEDAHIYRPGHPLAQSILNEVKKKHVDGAELVFDYSNNPSIISVLKPLIGKNGVMKVSNYTIEALEAEDHVLISAFDEKGNAVEHDIASKLFSLEGQIQNDRIVITNDERNKLNNIEQETINLKSSHSVERNSEFFDDEVDKLDKWADDMKKALELDLKKLDIDIKTAKTNAKKIVELEEKVKVQRQIKDMEKKRNEMRRKLYEAQDEVDVRKEDLIARVEAQLKQRARLEPLFIVRWRLK